MNEIKEKISKLIQSVVPFDEIERNHQQDILDWIASGAEIIRIEKPATPLKHLVCYSVLVDSKERKILLLDHLKALKKLPGGGHVNKDELPLEAAERELVEELEIDPKPIFNSESPLFVTVTETVGITAGHIDVDLWYVFEGDSSTPIKSETDEFNREFGGYRWLSFDEILSTPIEEFDPNMYRFVEKLKLVIEI